jgi:hypothetical protein
MASSYARMQGRSRGIAGKKGIGAALGRDCGGARYLETLQRTRTHLTTFQGSNLTLAHVLERECANDVANPFARAAMAYLPLKMVRH